MSTYATADELKGRLSPTGDTISDHWANDVDLALEVATASIRDHCGQEFYPIATATDQYLWPQYNRSDGAWEVRLNQPVWAITSVTVDGSDSGSYSTTWTAGTHYIAEPQGGVRDGMTGWPTTHLRLSSNTAPRCSGFNKSVKVTGKVGWSAVPYKVKQACLLVAAEQVQLPELKFGVYAVDASDFGGIRVSANVLRAAQGLLEQLRILGGIA